MENENNKLLTQNWMAHLRHDLSNGVNGIIGYSELILEELEELEELDLDEDQQWIEKIQNINQCGKQILSFIKIHISAEKVKELKTQHHIQNSLTKLQEDVASPLKVIAEYCQDIVPIIEAEFVKDVQKIQKAVSIIENIVEKFNSVSEIKTYILKNNKDKDKNQKTTLPKIDQFTSKIFSPQTKSIAEKNVKQGNILVVDDSDNNRELLSRQITEQGYNVFAVDNGRKAIDLIQTGKYDLIFLDVIMPEIDGYQVLEWLQNSPWYYIPVIMISALDEIDSIVKCIEMGAEDYLHKPFNPVLLKARIKPCLEKKKLRDKDLENLSKAYSELEQKNNLLRKIFGRYLSEEIVNSLLENPLNLHLGGERKTITILTSDLRGFTSISEILSPEQVLKILNFYFKHMADIIATYQGTIDKFMGDGILVLFGAPNHREDDTIRAVACAVEMQLAMNIINEKIASWNLPLLKMGIGINTGDVVVGNIGSERRTDYSAVGSQVNLTYRIESYTTGGQIFISEATYEKVKNIAKIKDIKQIKPQGIKNPIVIYDVIGIGGKYKKFLLQTEEKFFELPQGMQVQYSLLEGKSITHSVFDGLIIKLSDQGALIQPHAIYHDGLPEELVNIKLNLLNEAQNEYSDDIYAKVISYSEDNSSFYIHFSFKPPEISKRLETIYRTIKALYSLS
jgi:adenylate cyclase